MKKNVSPEDSYIRFLVGMSFLLNIIILNPGVIGFIILLTLGLVMIYSSLSRYSILYEILNINKCEDTCKDDAEVEDQ
ncbi:MAG: DUF2892 domain-containing protein [Spirochaetota bacterium]|nr:DUF2892 domain-containing protein [Spirochaetota bacterium]